MLALLGWSLRTSNTEAQMTTGLKEIDSYKAFRYGEHQLDLAVKYGKIDREQARRILVQARESYKNQTYNRVIAKVNAGYKGANK